MLQVQPIGKSVETIDPRKVTTMTSTPTSTRITPPLLLAGLLQLALAGPAQAGISAVGFDAAALPGGIAKPAVRVDFDAAFEMVAMDLSVSFDDTLLGLLPDQGTVDWMDGASSQTYTLDDFLAGLAGMGNLVVGGSDGYYALSFITVSPVTLAGSWTFHLPFQVNLPAGGQTQVTAGITLADDFGYEFGPAEVALNVSAVPEPQEWALWLAGLGLLAAYGRLSARRSAHPAHG